MLWYLNSATSAVCSSLSARLTPRLCFDKPLEILAALLRQRNTGILCWPLEAFESLNTQDQAELLMALRRHLFEETTTWYCWRGCMSLSQHPLVLPTALGEIGCGISPARPQHNLPADSPEEIMAWNFHQDDLSSVFMTVGDADTVRHPQFFGAFTFRVPAFDPRQCHS